MIHEAIILCGGLGTRLRQVVSDVPKTMADISGKPFMAYLLDYVGRQGIKRVILSVGYKRESIQTYFKEEYKDIKITYSVEKEPLGTGGAIKKALKFADESDIFVMNGDTFFEIDLRKLYEFHDVKKAALSMAVKRLPFNQRYGRLILDKNDRVTGFSEKSETPEGLINGGVYVLDKSRFSALQFPEKFSFEKDFLEKYYDKESFYALVFDGYFIDIGIPEDYEKAKHEFMKV